MMSINGLIPMPMMSDSYKATHFEQYPAAKKMVAVRMDGELFKGMQKCVC